MTLWKKDIPPQEKTTDKPTEIRKLAGGQDFPTMAASAPSDTSSDTAIPTGSKPAKRGRPYASQPVSQITQKTIEDAEAKAKRDAALNKIAAGMMEDTAAMPYEVWAFVAHDSSLRLTREEEKDLAQAYQLVSEYVSAGKMLPAWVILPLFIAGRNAKLIKKRVQEMAEKEDRKAIDVIEKGKVPKL